MTYVEITDGQLNSWNENAYGVGLATFKLPVTFTRVNGKYETGLHYHEASYKITWVSVDRRQLSFQRIKEAEATKNISPRKPKKKPKPEPPESFELQSETYVSHDHFGSREAGEEAVLENTPEPYKQKFHTTFEEIHDYPGFVGITSQHVTGRIGMPPKGNSVPALMNACVRRHRKEGMDKIITIKSPYDMRKLTADERHEHELRIWGYPDQKKLYAADPEGWLSNFWSWWNKNFPPNLETA